MELIAYISKFELSVTGGYAIYFLMCVAYVTTLIMKDIKSYVVDKMRTKPKKIRKK